MNFFVKTDGRLWWKQVLSGILMVPIVLFYAIAIIMLVGIGATITIKTLYSLGILVISLSGIVLYAVLLAWSKKIPSTKLVRPHWYDSDEYDMGDNVDINDN